MPPRLQTPPAPPDGGGYDVNVQLVSLSEVSLRLANQPHPERFVGKHEIVSLSGTLSKNGTHLHMSVANSEGQIFGGHVVEGSIIYTTAEIVILEMSELVFEREFCPISGFNELLVSTRNEES